MIIFWNTETQTLKGIIVSIVGLLIMNMSRLQSQEGKVSRHGSPSKRFRKKEALNTMCKLIK